MIDLLLTAIVLMMLASCVLYKSKVYPEENPDFFDIPNTTSLRGIWSIIVILVHIPGEYGNLIQDMAGSFAYIGVTFYFLLSGYGLSLGVMRRGFTRKGFWKKRLSKLLVPQLLVNITSMLLFRIIFGDKFAFSSLVLIAGWTLWLLACYGVFWLAHMLCRNVRLQNAFLVLAILAISISQYWLKNSGSITATIWPTEIWGFLWGILLAMFVPRFRSFGKNRWLLKTAIVCMVSVCLGLLYLKLKFVAFWGDYLLKILLGCAITLFVLMLNLRISIGNKALAFLGKISYELYLSHSVVILLLMRAMPHVSSGVFIVLVLALSIILSAILHHISEFLLHAMFGARKKT